MRKPNRSDDKYWEGTRNFKQIRYDHDIDVYISYLESKIYQHEKEKTNPSTRS